MLRKKCPHSKLFWTAFSQHSVRMRENAVQNNSEYGHFSRIAKEKLNQNVWLLILPYESKLWTKVHSPPNQKLVRHSAYTYRYWKGFQLYLQLLSLCECEIMICKSALVTDIFTIGASVWLRFLNHLLLGRCTLFT